MKGVLSYFTPNLSFQRPCWSDPLPKGWLHPWRVNVLVVGPHGQVCMINLSAFFWQKKKYNNNNKLGTPPALPPINTNCVRYSQPGYGWNKSTPIFRVMKIKLPESVCSILPPIFYPLGTRAQSYTYNLPSLNLYFQTWGASWKEKSPKEWRRRENGPNDLQIRKQIPEQREWTLMLFQKVWWQ